MWGDDSIMTPGWEGVSGLEFVGDVHVMSGWRVWFSSVKKILSAILMELFSVSDMGRKNILKALDAL